MPRMLPDGRRIFHHTGKFQLSSKNLPTALDHLRNSVRRALTMLRGKNASGFFSDESLHRHYKGVAPCDWGIVQW